MKAYYSPDLEQAINKLIPEAEERAEDGIWQFESENGVSLDNEARNELFNRLFHEAMNEMTVKEGLRIQ